MSVDHRQAVMVHAVFILALFTCLLFLWFVIFSFLLYLQYHCTLLSFPPWIISFPLVFLSLHFSFLLPLSFPFCFLFLFPFPFPFSFFYATVSFHFHFFFFSSSLFHLIPFLFLSIFSSYIVPFPVSFPVPSLFFSPSSFISIYIPFPFFHCPLSFYVPFPVPCSIFPSCTFYFPLPSVTFLSPFLFHFHFHFLCHPFPFPFPFALSCSFFLFPFPSVLFSPSPFISIPLGFPFSPVTLFLSSFIISFPFSFLILSIFPFLFFSSFLLPSPSAFISFPLPFFHISHSFSFHFHFPFALWFFLPLLFNFLFPFLISPISFPPFSLSFCLFITLHLHFLSPFVSCLSLFHFPFLFVLSLSPSVFFFLPPFISIHLSFPFLSLFPYLFIFSFSFLNLLPFSFTFSSLFHLFLSSLFLLIPSISLYIFPSCYFPFCFPILPIIPLYFLSCSSSFSFPSPLRFPPLSNPFHFSNHHHFLISSGTFKGFKAFHDTIGIYGSSIFMKLICLPHQRLYHLVYLSITLYLSRCHFWNHLASVHLYLVSHLRISHELHSSVALLTEQVMRETEFSKTEYGSLYNTYS